jgi:hypothetical protein
MKPGTPSLLSLSRIACDIQHTFLKNGPVAVGTGGKYGLAYALRVTCVTALARWCA